MASLSVGASPLDFDEQGAMRPTISTTTSEAWNYVLAQQALRALFGSQLQFHRELRKVAVINI
jgi:hypothetical protein